MPVGFSEIEPYPCRVLASKFPDVKNYGDMTKYKEWGLERGAVDIIVGGTPCQAFSVAGMRKGMEDPRGNLALGFVGMVDFLRPEWVVWENVPGVLSSNGGRDFGSILGAFSELGYGWSYRVLDAQYFGVPQRRQRIFLVGHSSGDSRRAGKVLFEPDCVQRHPSESRKTRKVTATATTTGTVSSKWAKGAGGPAGDEAYNLVTVLYENHPNDSRVNGPIDESPTVAARWGTGGGNTPLVQHAYRKSRRAQNTEDHESWIEDKVANTLNCFDVGDVRSTNLAVQPIAFQQNVREEVRLINGDGQITGALSAESGMHQQNFIAQPIALAENTIGRQPMNGGNGDGYTVGGPMYTLNATGVHGVAHTFKVRSGCEGGGKGYLGQDDKAFTISTSQDQYLSVNMVVRRLTPTECERLQGMPDEWAKAPGKESDSGRYKAIGNSMAVPVMKWIGERIQKESL
jgi:DNA (cytosine-5)-methyltransferase 1